MNKATLAALGALSLSVGALAPASAAPAQSTTPVLVELFTSEGCSDCPPADVVLSNLEQAQPVPGVTVIALGEHVDYWNNGSWRDRFSSRALTQRQNAYANSFHNSQVYTPQLVVDGKAEFVGSDRSAALSAIARAARLPKADVLLTKTGGNVTVNVSHLPAGTKNAQVFWAVTEDNLQSQVRGGENSGRHLTHNAVVRELRPLGTAKGGTAFTASVPLPSSGTNLVAFVQEAGTGRVLGASLLKL